ncbi:MAG: hypothetical protein Fur0046_02280 [Cyanobacteria bacterium J069]
MSLIKLTAAQPNQGSLVLYPQPISTGTGFSISFDFYAYGGSGGDGISFFLVDGDESPTQAGGFGGSLGYAPRNAEPGLVGGYLGIGFDAVGNYSIASEGRTGGRRPPLQDSVGIRGSASNSYRYLTGSGTLPVSLDNPGVGNRARSRRSVQVELSPRGLLSVYVDLNGDRDFNDRGEVVVNQFDVVRAGNGAVPATFKIGFAASTGALTNNHEIDNLTILSFNKRPLPGFSVGGTNIIGGDRNDVLTGGRGNDTIDGRGGNDTLRGEAGNDTLLGGLGRDVLVGGIGADGLTGDAGGDRFVFSGRNKTQALRMSLLRSPDRITDFNQTEGDRIQLDFDNRLNTRERPKALFNAGVIDRPGITTLAQAVSAAYADTRPGQPGNQRLKADQALFFEFQGQSYLSVNDRKAAFRPKNDLLVELTGIQYRDGDAQPGVLSVRNYFV